MCVCVCVIVKRDKKGVAHCRGKEGRKEGKKEERKKGKDGGREGTREVVQSKQDKERSSS